LGLFLQVGGAAVPELGDIEYRVQYGGRIAGAGLPAVADRRGNIVGAAGADAMTGIAADDVALGQTWFEEQPLAQFDLVRGQVPVLDDDLRFGNGLEQGAGRFAELVGRGSRRGRRLDTECHG